jgi:hypothetical protein
MLSFTKPPGYGKRVVNSSRVYAKGWQTRCKCNAKSYKTIKVWKEGGKVPINVNAKWHKTTKVWKEGVKLHIKYIDAKKCQEMPSFVIGNRFYA